MTRLNEQLGIPLPDGSFGRAAGDKDWQIGECLSIWWRPNFDTFLVGKDGQHNEYK